MTDDVLSNADTDLAQLIVDIHAADEGLAIALTAFARKVATKLSTDERAELAAIVKHAVAVESSIEAADRR
jgi:hypothetical protein